jgi:ABC-type uncharacterized transport system ATPase subunit
MAIILISSDLPEVLAMSDRILVMREGRQVAIFDHEDATQERVLSTAMGQDDPDMDSRRIEAAKEIEQAIGRVTTQETSHD